MKRSKKRTTIMRRDQAKRKRSERRCMYTPRLLVACIFPEETRSDSERMLRTLRWGRKRRPFCENKERERRRGRERKEILERSKRLD